jgi:hypothetical protein
MANWEKLPFLKWLTLVPTSSIIPTPSKPNLVPGIILIVLPCNMNKSVQHIAVLTIFTRASVSFSILDFNISSY